MLVLMKISKLKYILLTLILCSFLISTIGCMNKKGLVKPSTVSGDEEIGEIGKVDYVRKQQKYDYDGDGIIDMIEYATYDENGNMIKEEEDLDGDGTIEYVKN